MCNRCRLGRACAAVLLVSVAMAVLAPSLRADPIQWRGDARRREIALGTLQGLPVTAFHRHQSLPNQHEHELVVAVGSARQTLLEQMLATASLTLSLKGDVLDATYQDEHHFTATGTTVTLRWRWTPGTKRWVKLPDRIVDPYAQGRARLRAALARGDTGTARAMATLLGTSPDGGHTSQGPEIFAELVLGYVRIARQRHRAGQKREAAALVLDLLARPPFTADKGMADGAFYCLPATSHGPCKHPETFNYIAVTAETTAALTEAASFLFEAGPVFEIDPRSMAVSVLQEILSQSPAHAPAHLILADGLWQSRVAADRERARQHYRAYRDQRTSAGQSVPARVTQRLQDTTPPR
jgi:hypothetical protein